MSFTSKVKGFSLLLIGAAGGATAAYFFDPDRGRSRRAVASDQLAAAARDAVAQAERELDYRTGQIEGAVAEAVDTGDDAPVDDRTLKHRVETRVLGREDVPKGDIVVHAERGIVQLRGEVGDPVMIEEIVAATREVEGVHGVENLLHLPGQPEPSTAAVRDAGTGV